MRLALLSPYTDPVTGGITSYTRELARAYREMGLDCVGYASMGVSNQDFTVLGPGKVAFCLRAAMALLERKPTLVHAHSGHWYVVGPAIVTKLLHPSTKVLVTLHTPSEAGPGGLRATLIGYLLSLSDGVAFVSSDMMSKTMLPRPVRRRFIVSAPEQFAFASTSLAERGPMIVYSGPMVWPRKVAGVLLLVEAFALIKDRFPEWRLVILGDGPLRGNVEDRVKQLEIGDCVQLKGFVESVEAEVNMAAIYAHISLQEGLPLSVLNAMAMGATVLATKVGGIPEVVQHEVSGYLVDATKESISAGLSRLMADPDLRASLASRARVWVRTELSWRKVAEQHIEFAGVT